MIEVNPDKEVKLKNGSIAKVTAETSDGYSGKIAAGINDWWHAAIWDKTGHCIGHKIEDYDLVTGN